MDLKFNLSLGTAKDHQIPDLKKSLSQKVTKLTKQQIRRVKLPFQEALKIELEEQNLPKALEIFTKFLQIDAGHKNCFTRNKNKKLLEEVYEILKEFDTKKDPEDQVTILTKIIKRLFTENETFDWLIEYFLIKCNQLIAENELEHREVSVIVAYLHGISLSHRLHWHHAALLHFESAFKDSLGKQHWMFECEVLAIKISQELANCLIELSRKARIDDENAKTALIYASHALTVLRKVMADANVKMEIDAEIEYGNCLVSRGMFLEAKSHFDHGMALSEKCGEEAKYCECLIRIGSCQKGLQKRLVYKQILELAKEYALEHSLDELLGDILILQMEFYTENLDIVKVGEIFLEAFDRLLSLGRQKQLIEVEALFAHATAKMNFNAVVDLILKADKGEIGKNSYLQRLLNWIDQKSSDPLKEDSFEELELDEFIEKYYDPDEPVMLNRKTI